MIGRLSGVAATLAVIVAAAVIIFAQMVKEGYFGKRRKHDK